MSLRCAALAITVESTSHSTRSLRWGVSAAKIRARLYLTAARRKVHRAWLQHEASQVCSYHTIHFARNSEFTLTKASGAFREPMIHEC